jgi:O-acetyl-ADP-ribose deacetylase (regulator of RNase III)
MMMLTYHRTSLLTSKAQTLVNTVNTVGVMGKGLAADFKHRYPAMYQEYRRVCTSKLLEVGKLWLWKGGDQWVLNFPTKKHWRNPSKMDFIELGLEKFVAEYERRGITEIAFPRLGCGNGGLEWNEVREVMHSYLSPLPIQIYIHDYAADLPIAEHLAGSAAMGGLYQDFVGDIRAAVANKGGRFRTLATCDSYSAYFDDTSETVRLVSDDSTFEVADTDLYDLWVLLQKGPVEVERMVGGAKEAGAFLLPVLTSLQYLRLVEVAKDGDTGSFAVEVAERASGVLEAA